MHQFLQIQFSLTEQSQAFQVLFYLFNSYFYNNWWAQMRAKKLQQLSPQHQLLVFFSSYLRDMFNVIKGLKDTVYQLIGIQSAAPKNYFISTDIHSILLACNTGYEDLRRVQTLLKGHLKGKMTSEVFTESFSQSWKIAPNNSKSRLIKNESKMDNDNSRKSQGNHYKSNTTEGKRQYEVEQRLDIQARQRRIDEAQSQNHQIPDLRKIVTSKSQGQLSAGKQQPGSFLAQHQEKSSLKLIKKIRNELESAFTAK